MIICCLFKAITHLVRVVQNSEIMISRENIRTCRNPPPVPLRLSRASVADTWNWSRICEVRRQRPAAWATVRSDYTTSTTISEANYVKKLRDEILRTNRISIFLARFFLQQRLCHCYWTRNKLHERAVSKIVTSTMCIWGKVISSQIQHGLSIASRDIKPKWEIYVWR